MKRVAVFGSTGCVGTKTLEVIRHFPDEFEVYALSCNQNIELLKKQIEEFSPKVVSVGDTRKMGEFDFKNKETIENIVKDANVDVVVFAMSGMSGIGAAFLAAKHKKIIAIANKEILVCAGESFMSLCREKNVQVYSLDNEQSALDQSLIGEKKDEVDKLILTASGGPFYRRSDFSGLTLKDAMKHPTHFCGKKIAVNCSTLMNKGLEMIEAKHFFQIENIDVVIHPQSIVQSLVSFKDGVIKTVMSKPDLSYSIQYALFQKQRKKTFLKPLSFDDGLTLEFYPKDMKRFRCLKIAYDVFKEGGAKPAYLNGANEVLVERFCQGELSWEQIGETLDRLMNKCLWRESSLEAVLEADKKARMDALAISVR